MQPPVVVGVVEIPRDRSTRVVVVGVVSNTSLIVLEGSHETFADRVIRGSTRPTHADLNRMRAQDGEVLVGTVRTASIRVVDETRCRLAPAQCHFKSLDRQRRAKVARHRPADASAAISIQHDCYEDESSEQTHVREVRDPERSIRVGLRPRARFG